MERWSTSFPLALLAMLAALTLWLDRTVQPPSTARDGSARHDPDYIVDNLSAVRLGPDGVPQHQVEAKRMLHYPDDDTTHLESPRYVSFEGKQPQISIVSETALVSREGGAVDFYSNVRAVRAPTEKNSELVLTTEHLRVIPDDHVAYTDSPVTIVDANTKLTAVGLELDDKAKTVKLKSNVRGSYIPPRKK
jgi:lipopolysaccharide export system protein LptC